MEGEHVLIAGWPVQILAPGDPLVKEALTCAERIDIDGVPATVFTAEHTAAIALSTASAKDMSRLLQFIQAAVFDSARFDDIIRRHDLTAKWHGFGEIPMTFAWEKINADKEALRRRLAALPISEKLVLLDKLRERTLAIKNATRLPKTPEAK